MRIGYFNNSNELLGRLHALNHQQNQLQTQLSTGQRVQSLSESPATAARAMSIVSRKDDLQAYAMNLRHARTIADSSLNALEQLKEIANSAVSNLNGVDDLSDVNDLLGRGLEMNHLIEQAVSLSNEKVDGQHLFGAGRSGNPPYEVVRYQAGEALYDPSQAPDPATGNPPLLPGPVTVPDNLVGKIAFVRYTGPEASGSELAFRVGQNATLSPFPSAPANAEHALHINQMIAVRDAELTNDTASLSNMAGSLEAGQQHVNLRMLETGSTINGIDTLKSVNERRFSQLESAASEELDIDMAETIVRLRNSQTAYEAALNSSSRLMSLSLLDYLQ